MHEPLTDERLAEIKARWEAATEGPWRRDEEGYTTIVSETVGCENEWAEDGWLDAIIVDDVYSEADCEFILHSWQDVGDLLAEVDYWRRKYEVADADRTRYARDSGEARVASRGWSHAAEEIVEGLGVEWPEGVPFRDVVLGAFERCQDGEP